MDEFLEDLKSGEIQIRDRWQFELKSDLFLSPHRHKSTYNQEFYFFIPNALQINETTYTKEEFYQDLTNLIRYKTPSFSLEGLLEAPTSPLCRLQTTHDLSKIELNLKLIGSTFRSALRSQVQALLLKPVEEDLNVSLIDLCKKIALFQERFQTLEHTGITYKYVEEFISNTIDYYLTGLLDNLKNRNKISQEAENLLCATIVSSKQQTEEILSLDETKSDEVKSEQILYRAGLLKKFVMDALLLPTFRTSLQERYGNVIASLAAAIAMLLYISLFVFFGQTFVITSLPFILLTVITYVLKDRLKEGFKSLSYQKALRWFSDYSTKILSHDEKRELGVLKESFTFIPEKKLPDDIRTIRSRDFHYILETFKRPEQIIYFKRTITMYPISSTDRFSALNILLRYNIQNFLQKASNPYHLYTTLDGKTKTLIKRRLPKVYHFNIILKNTYMDAKNHPKEELKSFRLVLDKNGIKHLEPLQQKIVK